MSYLLENLIDGAKLRSLAPISQNTFTEDDLTNIANDELLLEVVADLLSVREDFFLTTKEISLRAGVSHYGIPKRAVGNSLKAVFYKNAANDETRLERGDVQDKDLWAGQTGEPEMFYLEGDEIVLVPTPASATGSLVISYFAKPNRLIATASCAKITNISSAGGTTTFTVDTDLSASLTTGDDVDILSAKSPFLLWADEIAITAITSTTIAVATSDVSAADSVVEPQVGDYICPTGYANIPMLPEEFHPYLAQKISNRLIAALGQLDKLQMGEAQAARLRDRALSLVKNRVESAPEILSTRSNLSRFFQG